MSDKDYYYETHLELLTQPELGGVQREEEGEWAGRMRPLLILIATVVASGSWSVIANMILYRLLFSRQQSGGSRNL